MKERKDLILSYAQGMYVPEAVFNKVLYGEAPPGGPTRNPFIYILIELRYPLHIPI